MLSLRSILPATVLCLGATLAAPAQEQDAPLETGDVRGLTVLPPEGTRVEYFRLDLPSDATPWGEKADPVGVVRWIAGPDLEDGEPVGRRLELAISFFDVDTRVIHTEHLRPHERKLVYREIRERGGRTVLLEWSPEEGPRVIEVVGQEARRRTLDAGRGVLLPLYLVEHVRAGASIEGPFPVFGPLAGGVENLDLEVREDGSREGRRVFSIRREGGLEAGRYTFEGERLVRFRWQAGGPVARPTTAEEYHAWRRRHRADRGH